MPVITRFAPSPTGYFHAGSYRTALFAWIYARQHKGKFILRIEDTDKERSKKEYEDNIIESLKWLGLEYDEFYRQSDRTEIYKKYIHKMIASGHAYISSAEEEMERRNAKNDKVNGNDTTEVRSVIRFKNPNKKVVFDDIIRGRVEFDTTELGDFVIAKSEDEPVFHLVVVIDDHEMGVTHVVRGEDHISNTPRQIMIYEAIGAPVPHYAHIPLLLSDDRSKLSKRHGALPISEYKSRGYLREAIINYLALLGWHPTDDREVLGMQDILKEFSLERVQKSGAIFDEEKLKWFNRQYLLKLSDENFLNQSLEFMPQWVREDTNLTTRLTSVLKEKISAFGEIQELLDPHGELGFIHQIGEYTKESILWKKKPDPKAARDHLTHIVSMLDNIGSESFTMEAVKRIVWPYAEENGKGDVLWPLRVALTGQDKSPDPFVCAGLLGKDETLRRIKSAIEVLKS